MRSIAFTLLVAACFAPLYYFRPQPMPVQTGATTSDSLTLIYAILDGDKKDCRLLDNWPQAPIVMLEAARKYKIDHCLLPTISRAEGPTPAMLKACNVYGLERQGKPIEFISHEYSTDAAAALLAKHKDKYHTGGLVDISKLAAIWCPISADQWAGNVSSIYQTALKK